MVSTDEPRTRSGLGLSRLFLLGLLLSASIAECRAQGTSQGPDVIIGDLLGVVRWGTVNGITGYSVGTESCNVGDAVLPWVGGTSDHPLIGQNLYRVSEGRIEQLGMSWLKHGFGALALELCGTCQDPETFDALGVGCSDPYSAALNGNQAGFGGLTGLGPRSEVNPVTGVFPFPYGSQGQSGDDVYKRLQVRVSDLDPALHPQARFFVEGHYVTPHDAQAGNGLNNVSYREVILGNFSGGGYELVPVSTTRTEVPAIEAWAELDPEVHVSRVDISGDGRIVVASKAVEVSGGVWRYEIALYNLNSHRSVRSLEIPLPEGASLGVTRFRDVDYHSGEPYAGTDWGVNVSAGSAPELVFSTDSYLIDQNANALRWGTLYSYSFELDVPPFGPGPVELGLFRPGTPETILAEAIVPTPILLREATAGTVNAGLGGPTDVLLVNSSPGVGPTRTVEVPRGQPLTLDLQLPPAVSGTDAFAVIWAWPHLPRRRTISSAPYGLRFTAMPSPLLPGRLPQPVRIANSFPSMFDPVLGANRWPGSVTKAPLRLLNLSGVNRSLIAFFQGIIEDPAAPNGFASVTNGVTLIVP